MGTIERLNTDSWTHPEDVLQNAINAELEYVVVIGRTDKGEMYYAGSTSNAADILFDIEKFKLMLLDIAE